LCTSYCSRVLLLVFFFLFFYLFPLLLSSPLFPYTTLFRSKVSFTLSLWALPTAMIPSRDHTGLPIHFHSSMISRSASRMLLRMLASVLPRQSVSPATSWSIRSDGFIGSRCLEFLSRFHASSFAAASCLAGLLEVSRRRRWPFHIHNPERTIMGTKTNRVAGA